MNKYYNIAKNELFSICRSITGNGIRKSLNIIKNNFPKLKLIKIRSGEKIFDWKVPLEWNIKDAFVKDKKGNKIIDFKSNNLHVVNFSVPINKKISKKDFLRKLHSNKKKLNAIPYVTSYYEKNWGFCTTHKQKKKIKRAYKSKDKFHVVIKSKLKKGNLVYGEYIIPGKSKKEILISTYLCHPSMANNELSGPIVSMGLIDYFKRKKNLKTIRFIFIPETIGSICFLKKNLNYLKKHLIGGFNLSCIGDERMYSYMPTIFGNTASDNSIEEAFKNLKIKFKKYNFIKDRGSDERQYNSPGVDLPISSIFRSKYGTYPEYHTSLDNFDIVTLKGVKQSLKVVVKAIQILLKKKVPIKNNLGEPHLSKNKYYKKLNNSLILRKNILDFLLLCDGRRDLQSISKILKISERNTNSTYRLLIKMNLIR